ncbi:hypothetical protein HQ545_08275, partial [Candidatus Woesearchaeota archaeon]|nr:hypothetical protein [Candidatus Woesearchaeota archaeon]
GYDDIGPHNVTVWVCDEAGLCDFQVVRIMIFDYPQLSVNGTNPYKDIPHNYASVEDFYRLSAEGTTSYYTPLLGYVFEDFTEPFEFMTSHPTQVLDLPISETGNERDIRYITDHIFTRDSLCDTEPCPISKQHLINMSLTSLSLPPKTHNVTVFQCLPHRNPYNMNMWPYNDETINPYEASHMCCSPGAEFNYTFTISEDFEGGEIAGFPNEYGEHLDRIEIINAEGEVLWNGGECATYFLSAPGPGDPPPCMLPFGIIEFNDFVRITFWDSSIVPVPPGDYILTQHVSTDRLPFYDTHPYGAWLGFETTCHGGNPMLGTLHSFEASDIDDPILGDITTVYEGTSEESAATAWWNDVVRMNYQRRCSENRGNICSGLAARSYDSIRNCLDMNEREEFDPDLDREIIVPKEYFGEVESCQGPNPTLINPIELVDPVSSCSDDSDCPDYYMCVEDNCYPRRGMLECQNFGTGEGDITSFEKAWNLPRLNDRATAATGICNPNKACGNSLEDFNIDNEEGDLILSHATCYNGVCQLATESRNCEDLDGQTSADNPTPYCVLPDDYTISSFDEEYYLMSHNFHCINEGEATCTITSINDPDQSQGMCEACMTRDLPEHHEGIWTARADQQACCGDDPGEGGFPYDISALSTESTGEWQRTENICDDTFQKPGSASYFGIDNDCNNLANCEDDSCYNPSGSSTPFIGPNQGYCCDTDDSICVDTFESHLSNPGLASCVDTECVCNDISGEDICTSEDPCPVHYSALTSGFTTCTPYYAGVQKYIEFISWPAGTSTININVDARRKTMSGEFCTGVQVCVGERCVDIEELNEEFAINEDDVINFKALSSAYDCHLNMMIV